MRKKTSRKKVRFSDNLEQEQDMKKEEEENRSEEENRLDDEVEKEEEDSMKKERKNKKQVTEGFENRKIEPSNYYSTDFNTPNFVSNVADLRKFYEYNSFDGLDKVPNVPVKENEYYMDKNKEIIDAVSKQPAYLQKGSNGETLTNEYWQYKNEMPMCGGEFGGINGFDTLNNGYATYEMSKDVSKPLLNDDLRNGMGVPQKEEYKYNMSLP